MVKRDYRGTGYERGSNNTQGHGCFAIAPLTPLYQSNVFVALNGLLRTTKPFEEGPWHKFFRHPSHESVMMAVGESYQI